MFISYQRYFSYGPALLLVISSFGCDNNVQSNFTEEFPSEPASREGENLAWRDIISWQIMPENASVSQGDSISFKALARLVKNPSVYVDITDKLSWTSESELLQQIPTEPNSFEAKAVGAASVKAILEAKSIEAKVNVLERSLRKMELSPDMTVIPIGAKTDFSVIGIYSDLKKEDIGSQVTVESSDEKIISARIINERLHLEANEKGRANLTFRLGGFNYVIDLTVGDEGVYDFALEPSDTILPKGLSLKASIYALISSGEKKDISSSVIVSSSNNDVLTFENGFFKAHQKGHAIVTLTYGALSKMYAFAVNDSLLKSISLSITGSSIPLGMRQAIIARGLYSDGETYDISRFVNFSLSTSAHLLLEDNYLKALSIGTTTVKARWLGVEASLNVTVSEPDVESVTLSPNPLTMPINGVGSEISAIATNSDKPSIDVTETCQWSIVEFSGTGTKPSIGDVSGSKGLVLTSPDPGTAKVKVDCVNNAGQTISANSELIVINSLSEIRIVPTLDIFPSDPVGSIIHVASGLSQNLRAEAIYLDSSVENITDKAQWYVDYYSPGLGSHGYLDRDNASQSFIPLITSSEGSLKVKASYQGASSELEVSVTAPTIAEGGLKCDITDGALSLKTNQSLSFDCQITLTDGSIINSSQIDQVGGWDLSWTIDTNAYAVFAGSGSLNNATSSSPVFSPGVDGEGYLDLIATASDGSPRSEEISFSVKIARNCSGGQPFGGAVNHSDNLFCWHVGTLGASCDDVCASYGGYQSATKVYGEDQTRCEALRNAIYTPPDNRILGVNVEPGVDKAGLGCAVNEFDSFVDSNYFPFLGDPEEASSASSSGVRRLCGCKQ